VPAIVSLTERALVPVLMASLSGMGNLLAL